jgi:hypothetical protein
MELPGWSTRLLADLDEADRRAIAVARSLTPSQLNWKPGEGRWSVGQCLEHLCINNDLYAPPIAGALTGTPGGSVPEITHGWFARWFIRAYIEPSPQTKRGRNPGRTTPASEVDPSVVDRLIAGNVTVRKLIRTAAGYDVNRLRFRNPYVPVIYFTVGSGLVILVRHQHRHLLQAERVVESAGFPRVDHTAR